MCSTMLGRLAMVVTADPVFASSLRAHPSDAWRFLVVRDGTQAASRAVVDRPELIVLDRWNSNTDVDAIRSEVARDPRIAHIPVIALSRA